VWESSERVGEHSSPGYWVGTPTRAGTTEPGRLLCVPWPVPGLVHERGLLVAGSGDG
jgi:hypothetical protein